jgi:hypothetical protein
MPAERPFQGRLLRWLADHATAGGLFAVLVASALVAARWTFLVPIYQSPDEPAHLDYALCIYEQGWLLRTSDKPLVPKPGECAHPCSLYLLDRTQTARVAFNPAARMTPDYGTRAFYRELDNEAPPVGSAAIGHTPYLTVVYPYGYYAILALWIGFIRVWTTSLVGLFFAARLFSVVLLMCTLLLVYATARELSLQRRFALLVTACVGLFPMTSFVASYIQPDNLALTLVSLCYYLALVARRRQGQGLILPLLGVSFAALLLTKVHYYLSVVVPIAAMLATDWWVARVPLRRWALLSFWLAVPSLLAMHSYLSLTQGMRNHYAQPLPHPEPLGYHLSAFKGALLDFYAGNSHNSFWGIFGWMDTPLMIKGTKTTMLVFFVLQAAAWLLFALTLVRLEQVASRLLMLAWRGRRRLALKIACGNPIINSYFLFTLLMFALYIRLQNLFGAQGRHWLPFLLPIFLTALVYAPKTLTLVRTRRFATFALAGGLVLYVATATPYALRTIKHRYYPHIHRRAALDIRAEDERGLPPAWPLAECP